MIVESRVQLEEPVIERHSTLVEDQLDAESFDHRMEERSESRR